MEEQFERSRLIFGDDGIEKLKNSRVAVFGIGGVGGFVAEALVRGGIGAIDLIDNDTVSVSNINRQIIATHKTVGMLKTQAMQERIKDINPRCTVRCSNVFLTSESIDDFDFSLYDYVVDAIDFVNGKTALAQRCELLGVPIISSMGTGNKLDPFALEITDIYKTSVCPLARAMRRELKAKGVKKLRVLYSKEAPVKSKETGGSGEKIAPGSNSFVPACAGLMLAGEVIKALLDI